jgi:hypothetical protein
MPYGLWDGLRLMRLRLMGLWAYGLWAYGLWAYVQELFDNSTLVEQGWSRLQLEHSLSSLFTRLNS